MSLYDTVRWRQSVWKFASTTHTEPPNNPHHPGHLGAPTGEGDGALRPRDAALVDDLNDLRAA